MVRLLTRRVIHNLEGSPYLIRWTLISTPWFRIFLHKILRSDDDRDLHDHPWPFWTFILWGRYTEHVPAHSPPQWDSCDRMITKSRKFGSGSLIRHKAEDSHRLDLEFTDEFEAARERNPQSAVFAYIYGGKELYKPVWTLFWAGPRTREWGFHTAMGWLPWETYCNTRNHDPSDIEDC